MTTGRWDGVQGWGTARVVPHLDGQTMRRTTVVAREGPKNGGRHEQAPMLDLRPKPKFGALMALGKPTALKTLSHTTEVGLSLTGPGHRNADVSQGVSRVSRHVSRTFRRFHGMPHT